MEETWIVGVEAAGTTVGTTVGESGGGLPAEYGIPMQSLCILTLILICPRGDRAAATCCGYAVCAYTGTVSAILVLLSAACRLLSLCAAVSGWLAESSGNRSTTVIKYKQDR